MMSAISLGPHRLTGRPIIWGMAAVVLPVAIALLIDGRSLAAWFLYFMVALPLVLLPLGFVIDVGSALTRPKPREWRWVFSLFAIGFSCAMVVLVFLIVKGAPA